MDPAAAQLNLLPARNVSEYAIRWIIQYAHRWRRYGIHQLQGDIMKKIVIASLGTVLVTTVALAYEVHHPNLRDAYSATESAISHLQEARAANKGIEFGGHAERALADLQNAEREIQAADKWNDEHHHAGMRRHK